MTSWKGKVVQCTIAGRISNVPGDSDDYKIAPVRELRTFSKPSPWVSLQSHEEKDAIIVAEEF